jgi:hypothetical protein
MARRSQPPRIELEPDGFATVGAAGDRHPIRWTSVAKVAAFKRDHFTTDEIVVLFEVDEHPGMVQQVSEEWTGFPDLFAPMEQRLGISPSWYREIMVPAFEPMYRVLYDRSEPQTLRSGASG